ncbi:MAG: GNAT family N-acetyltransferase, partial [Burkholderiaceae bacterium]
HRLDAAKTEAERARYARSNDTTFVAQFEDEMAIACGSVAVEGAIAGIFGMVTAESHRGRGIASALVASLLEHARNAGAHTAYLQVEVDNTPARHTYSKFGFDDCYAYWYRRRDDETA